MVVSERQAAMLKEMGIRLWRPPVPDAASASPLQADAVEAAPAAAAPVPRAGTEALRPMTPPAAASILQGITRDSVMKLARGLDAVYVPLQVDALEPFAYDRIYGAWWDLHVNADAKAAVRRSTDRYVAAIAGPPAFAAGDRIGYVTAGYGAYASHRLLPAALLLSEFAPAVTSPCTPGASAAAARGLRLIGSVSTSSYEKFRQSNQFALHDFFTGVVQRIDRIDYFFLDGYQAYEQAQEEQQGEHHVQINAVSQFFAGGIN